MSMFKWGDSDSDRVTARARSRCRRSYHGDFELRSTQTHCETYRESESIVRLSQFGTASATAESRGCMESDEPESLSQFESPAVSATVALLARAPSSSSPGGPS